MSEDTVKSCFIDPNAVGGAKVWQPVGNDAADNQKAYRLTPGYPYSYIGGSPAFKAMNKTVLCEPFKTNTVKKKERSGFATVDQKVSLTGLRVFVGTDEIPVGATVFVRSEACQSGWGKEIFEAEGQPPFIRVPESEIVYLQRWDPNFGQWTLGIATNNQVLDWSTAPGTITVKALAEGTINATP